MANALRSETPCLVCGHQQFRDLFDGKIINTHVLKSCESCSMVQAFAWEDVSSFDYADYGDYLLLSDDEIQRRIRFVGRTMRRVFTLLRQRNGEVRVLDVGSGAGYFCKAAEKHGLSAFGVELSDKLIEFSKKKVGFQKVFKRIEDIDSQFDAIFMSDVIEHLPPAKSRRIMTDLTDRLKPNGLLIGNTPNFRSANILICKDADPVVAPPSHMCYFSLKTLDRYLSGLGLARIRLYSRGLSSNSFFRKNKFERSFLEKGLRQARLVQLPLLISLRVMFAAGGYLLQPFGLGYQVYFMYQKQ